MPFTAEQIVQVRTWLPWDPPTDSDLIARSDELGSDSIFPVVREQLRRQLLLLMVTPAQFTIPGDWSQNTSENMKQLRQLMADAEAAQDEEGIVSSNAVTVQQLTRYDPSRATPTRVC